MNKTYVQITKSFLPTYWYANHIGEIFSIHPSKKYSEDFELQNMDGYFIKKTDCKFVKVDVIPQEEDELDLVEPSPEELAIMNQSALELEAQFVGE